MQKFAPVKILRRLLRPMLDQLGTYHEANFHVISRLLADVNELKRQIAVRDERANERIDKQ